jgi:hypothetical protein
MTDAPMIKVTVRRGRTTPDLVPIPSWLGNPQEVGPCPCGQPADEDCMLIEGDAPLSRWFHLDCLDFLEKEMDEDEIKEKHEWEREVKRLREENDDE